MSLPFTFLPDIGAAVEIPKDGILSRTVYSDPTVNVVMFGFDAGQELSEHTASRPALIQILSGTATLTLGDTSVEAGPGGWVHMPVGLPHSIKAITPLIMQLTMLPLPSAAPTAA